MTVRAGWYTPMLHVRDVARSIAFYEMLGFEVVDTEGKSPLVWARLHCEGGALMLLRVEDPVNPHEQGVISYMYTPDLVAMHRFLVGRVQNLSEIQYPDHGPAGEIYFSDPDGYRVAIMHWGEKEHSEWLKRIGGAV